MATRAPARTLETLLVTDLSGGGNDTHVSSLIKNSEAQAFSNVFFGLRGGVEKRYGYAAYTNSPVSVNSAFTGGVPKGVFAFSNGQNVGITGDYGLVMYTAAGTSVSTGIFPISYVLNAIGTTPSMVTYNNGTVTLTNGSAAAVLASGTAEYLTQIKPNDLLRDGSTIYVVNTVVDNSNFTLITTYTGTTGAKPLQILQQALKGQAAQFKSNMYYGAAEGGIIYWDPLVLGGTKRLASPPSTFTPQLFCNFQNYLFAATIGAASRIYWSALLDGTTWPSTNFIDVSPNDGDSIRALIVHNNILYIFKDHSVWYLVGSVFDPANPSYSLNRVINPQNIGAPQGASVKVFNGRLVWLGQDGIYALDGVAYPQNISEPKLRTTIRGITNRQNALISDQCSACVYDNRYWLSVVSNLTICLEPNGAFSTHTFYFPAYSLSLGNDGTNDMMIGVEGSGNKFIKFDGTATNDGSTAITATYSSKVFSLGGIVSTAHVEDVFVAYQNTTNQAVSLSVYDDSGIVGSSTAWTFPGGTTQAVTVQRFAVDRDTNGLYLSITDNTSSKSFRVLGYAIRYWRDTVGSGVIVTS